MAVFRIFYSHMYAIANDCMSETDIEFKVKFGLLNRSVTVFTEWNVSTLAITKPIKIQKKKTVILHYA